MNREKTKGSILVVDDTLSSLWLLSQILTAEGYDVYSADSGELALRAVATQLPDLILLDIFMPGKSGFEVCQQLKAQERTRAIPIIFISASTEVQERLTGFELGAADYISKPFQREELLARIDAHLTLRRSNLLLIQAQNQLLQSEKMASIGLLAAGVAHEINNPLGYVNSNLGSLAKYVQDIFVLLEKYAQLERCIDQEQPLLQDIRAFKQQIDLDYVRADVHDLLNESRTGLARVKNVVLDLKNFSHSGSEETWAWVDLHQGIDSTVNVVWNEVKYKCQLVKEYGVLPQVQCLPLQLNQVFMNLLINAAQAIDTAGVITIRTGTVGEDVWVEVADTGKGIAPEHLKRLFDPFFTTKPVGQGSGLGLSVSSDIIKKHHGSIEVTSEPGQGSTFRVRIPAQHMQGKATPHGTL